MQMLTSLLVVVCRGMGLCLLIVHANADARSHTATDMAAPSDISGRSGCMLLPIEMHAESYVRRAINCSISLHVIQACDGCIQPLLLICDVYCMPGKPSSACSYSFPRIMSSNQVSSSKASVIPSALQLLDLASITLTSIQCMIRHAPRSRHASDFCLPLLIDMLC